MKFNFTFVRSWTAKQKIKFADTASTKSYFVRKSALASLGNGKDFKFNFPLAELEQLQLSTANDGNAAEPSSPVESSDKIADGMVKQPAATFIPTDNSFRFNFNIVAEQE